MEYLEELKSSNQVLHEAIFNKNKRLIHLSKDPLRSPAPGVDPYRAPSLPSNQYTSDGFEEADIKRISVAPDIDHCLLAIGDIVLDGNRIWNVYEVKEYKDIKEVTNKELIRKGWVPDAKQTKESWLLTPTQFRLLGQIRIIRKSNKFVVVPDFRKKQRGHDPRSRDDRKIYFYDWRFTSGGMN